MVDAHRARMREHVVHHFAVHAITGFGEIVRIERRLAPVLALLVVEVRRAANGDAADGEAFRIPPHVGAQRVHAHSHVLHEAQCHAAFACGGLRGGHLFVGDPLQPAFEFDHVGMIAHEFGHFRRITVRLREPCALPWGAPHLEGHRPRGECAQIRAGRLLERFECGLTLGGTRHLEHELQRLALVPPRGVDVEFVGIVVGGSDFGVQALDFGQRGLVKPRIFLDILRANVGDVHESARFRQVRRRFERLDRRGCVDRVDEHEIGMRLFGGVGEQQLQIAVVAHAPRFGGADGIHLRHPTPTLLFGNRRRQRYACRGADQSRLAVQRARVDAQRVVAGGNVVRQGERERAVGLRGQIHAQVALIPRAVLKQQA